MKNKNRRFRDAGLAVFVSSFRFRLIGQGATGFEKGSSVDRLWRHRLSSGKARFFDSAAHTLLRSEERRVGKEGRSGGPADRREETSWVAQRDHRQKRAG